MDHKHADLFKVLGVETRIRIIELLKQKGALGVNEISEILGISSSAVSQHLKILKYAGLVRSERKGYWIPYEVDTDALSQCGESLYKVCCCKKTGPDCCPDSDETVDKLALLREYEEELREELKKVQAQIRELSESM